MTDSVSLASLMVPGKDAEFEYPGMEDWKLTLCHLSSSSKQKLAEKHTVHKYNKDHKLTIPELDDEGFMEEFATKTVTNWTGLKYRYLEELLPVDISNKDPEDELPYSAENAVLLVKNSEPFTEWLTEVVKNLSNFTKNK